MKKKIILVFGSFLAMTILIVAIIHLNKTAPPNAQSGIKVQSTLKKILSIPTTSEAIVTTAEETHNCNDTESPKCTLTELARLLEKDDKWLEVIINKVKKKCENQSGEYCGIYASYLYDSEQYSESIKFFEKSCKLGERKSCCDAIWIQDRPKIKKQSTEETRKMFQELNKERCFTEHPDSTVFGIKDQIERNGDYDTNNDYYIKLLILSCHDGSALGCLEAAQRMSKLEKPYVLTKTLYNIACRENKKEACEEALVQEKKAINSKADIKGNPEYPLDGNYTLNMGVFATLERAERELVLYETEGYWSVINEIADDQFMVVVGKFKSQKEAQAFISQNKDIEEKYKFISKFD